MMILTSIYGVIDGYFISNFVGKTQFAAINFIYPFIMILGGTGFMIGTGGTALVAKTLGEGNEKRANELFTIMIKFCILLGIILTVSGILLIRPICILLKATEEMTDYCVIYGSIVISFTTFFMLQSNFHSFFSAAEKQRMGLAVTIIAGCANAALDALFIVVFDWGLVGAALATGIGQVIGGLVPLVYFARPNASRLRFVKAKLELKPVLAACANGSSELLTNVSSSIVSMLYNMQLMRFYGEDGVSAYGVLMYVSMIFQAIFIGYAVGTAPITSFNFGAKNKAELKSLLRKSGGIIGVCAIVMFLSGELLSAPLSRLFVGYDAELFKITNHAFSIFSFSFLLSGFSVFGSSFFTALNDGLTSAVISFMRTLVFQIAAVILFPIIWDIDGIWLSIVGAEIMSIAVTLFFLLIKRRKYGY